MGYAVQVCNSLAGCSSTGLCKLEDRQYQNGRDNCSVLCGCTAACFSLVAGWGGCPAGDKIYCWWLADGSPHGVLLSCIPGSVCSTKLRGIFQPPPAWTQDLYVSVAPLHHMPCCVLLLLSPDCRCETGSYALPLSTQRKLSRSNADLIAIYCTWEYLLLVS